jgi:ribosome-associated protein
MKAVLRSFIEFSAESRHVKASPVFRPERKRIAALIPTIAREAAAPLHPVPGSIESAAGSVLQSVLASLEDSKAEDVIPIDLQGKTSIADMMIVASGRSNTHVGAIADRMIKTLKEVGVTVRRVEGLPHCDWVLIDAGDVIVHVFRPEVRQFYNLEKMWGTDRPGERRVG